MAKSRRHLYRQTPMTILLLRPARYNIAYNGIYKMTIGNGDINALRDSVRRFVAAAVLPCVQQIENDGTMPRAVIVNLRRAVVALLTNGESPKCPRRFRIVWHRARILPPDILRYTR